MRSLERIKEEAGNCQTPPWVAPDFCEDTKAAADKQNKQLKHVSPAWIAEIARVLYSRSLFETRIYITDPLKYYNEWGIELLIKKWSL